MPRVAKIINGFYFLPVNPCAVFSLVLNVWDCLKNNGISDRWGFPDIQVSSFQAFNCSCIGPAVNGTQPAAEKGYCDRGPGCKNFTYFLVISFALLLAVFLTAIPNKTVVLR